VEFCEVRPYGVLGSCFEEAYSPGYVEKESEIPLNIEEG
jgi:hypothetical protein